MDRPVLTAQAGMWILNSIPDRISQAIHGDTWIRLYGILREGMGHISKDITAPFYHLEAVKVEKIPYNGKGTIAD